jgi:hypothetical protein
MERSWGVETQARCSTPIFPQLPGVIAMPETVVHFQIRMPPVLHEQLASWAKEDKASLNALIVGILEKAIAQHEPKGATKE